MTLLNKTQILGKSRDWSTNKVWKSPLTTRHQTPHSTHPGKELDVCHPHSPQKKKKEKKKGGGGRGEEEGSCLIMENTSVTCLNLLILWLHNLHFCFWLQARPLITEDDSFCFFPSFLSSSSWQGSQWLNQEVSLAREEDNEDMHIISHPYSCHICLWHIQNKNDFQTGETWGWFQFTPSPLFFRTDKDGW